MFSICLKSAWRNLVKHRYFSFIAVAGLAIGLCSCILIILYVNAVADFHQKSLKGGIEPVLLLPMLPGHYSQFSIKIVPKQLSSTLDALQNAYAVYFPGNVFDYYFLDENLTGNTIMITCSANPADSLRSE